MIAQDYKKGEDIVYDVDFHQKIVSSEEFFKHIEKCIEEERDERQLFVRLQKVAAKDGLGNTWSPSYVGFSSTVWNEDTLELIVKMVFLFSEVDKSGTCILTGDIKGTAATWRGTLNDSHLKHGVHTIFCRDFKIAFDKGLSGGSIPPKSTDTSIGLDELMIS